MCKKSKPYILSRANKPKKEVNTQSYFTTDQYDLWYLSNITLLFTYDRFGPWYLLTGDSILGIYYDRFNPEYLLMADLVLGIHLGLNRFWYLPLTPGIY